MLAICSCSVATRSNLIEVLQGDGLPRHRFTGDQRFEALSLCLSYQ
jgi:hypothetical protein